MTLQDGGGSCRVVGCSVRAVLENTVYRRYIRHFSVCSLSSKLMLSMYIDIVEGVEFFLDGDMTNGPVSVTAIGIFETADDTPLICQSEAAGTAGSSNWYLDPEQQNIDDNDSIQTGGDRGWRRTRDTTPDGFQQVLLRRQPALVTALEGVFTCQITATGDINPIRSLYILYPSELPTRPLRAL